MSYYGTTSATRTIKDPGAGGAIPAAAGGYCGVTTVGVEARTVVAPGKNGLELNLYFVADGGNCAITFPAAYNQAGNTIITNEDVRDYQRFVSLGGVWKLVVNDGGALS